MEATLIFKGGSLQENKSRLFNKFCDGKFGKNGIPLGEKK